MGEVAELVAELRALVPRQMDGYPIATALRSAADLLEKQQERLDGLHLLICGDCDGDEE